jgi:hypothetical protein
MAEGDVERLAGHVLHGEKRGAAFEAGVEHGHDPRPSDPGRDKTPQRFSESRHVLGDELEPKRFDRHKAIVLRFVRSKNGSEYAAADLVQDAIRAKGRRRVEV